jgi:hypothetical protein
MRVKDKYILICRFSVECRIKYRMNQYQSDSLAKIVNVDGRLIVIMCIVNANICVTVIFVVFMTLGKHVTRNPQPNPSKASHTSSGA